VLTETERGVGEVENSEFLPAPEKFFRRSDYLVRKTVKVRCKLAFGISASILVLYPTRPPGDHGPNCTYTFGLGCYSATCLGS
jgi:hypothetical protein